MNYYMILLNKKEEYIESDAIIFTFQVYNELHALQSDLSAFKFALRITNGADVVTKKDANYAGGSVSQIAVTFDKVNVFIDSDDTNNFYGDYVIEFQMQNKTSGSRQSYRKIINFYE